LAERGASILRAAAALNRTTTTVQGGKGLQHSLAGPRNLRAVIRAVDASAFKSRSNEPA
jgi:hypothetical protein